MTAARENRREFRVPATVTQEDLLNSAGATRWLMCTGAVAVQFTGDATDITAQVECSTRPPDSPAGPNIAPAGALLTGNPAGGMEPVSYDSCGLRWFRVRLAEAPIGGSVEIALTGYGN